MYNKILNELKLSDEDRKQLKDNRGFTDETIEYFKFKSAVTPSEAIGIVEKIGKAPLMKARLLDGETLIPAFTRNGLIPYHEDGDCVRVKGHKYGLPSTPPIVFQALREDQDTLYLCESEYKAAAMWQLGYSAIGLCGISTFINKHFKTLLSTLKVIRPKKCVVIFDNDDKADPESLKFSSDPAGRYDAFKYQWLIASLLSKRGIDAYVANLPDSWRKDGGCDIDGALADGHTREEFDNAIGESAHLTPDEFKDSWIGTGEMDEILTPWADAKLKTTQVKIKNNCMWSEDKAGDPLMLCNFDIEVTTIHIGPEGDVISRYVTVINEFGKKFQEAKIDNTDLSSANKFSTWCLAHPGNLVYSGESRNMHEIGTYLNIVSTPSVIKHVSHMGYHEETKSFLADTVAYENGSPVDIDDGKIFLKEGTVKVDQIETGSKAVSVDISSDYFDWRGAIERKVENYGDGQVRIAVMWCLASLMADVFERVTSPKLFPLLWVTGSMGSGKNTLISHSLSFVGIHGHEGLSISQVTIPMIWKRLGFYSSLPVWIDELRADRECAPFDGVWRSIYNRTCVSKSKMNTDGEIISNKVRGTIILTGQDISGDAALNQRFIPLEISANKRKGNQYGWIKKNKSKFSYAAHEVLVNRDSIEKYIEDNFDKERSAWKDRIFDDRLAGNIAVITTMANALGVDLKKDFDLGGWADRVGSDLASISDDSEFMSDLEVALRADPHMVSKVFNPKTKNGNYIFMDFNTAYAFLNKTPARALNRMSKKAIVAEMLDNGLAAKKTTGRVLDGGNKTATCRGLHLRRDKMEQELIDMIERDMIINTVRHAEGGF